MSHDAEERTFWQKEQPQQTQRQKNTCCVEGTARKTVCLEQREGREGS